MKGPKPVVVIGLLGTTLDRGSRKVDRWSAWRPSVSLCRHPDLEVARFELLHGREWTSLASTVQSDVALISPETSTRLHVVDMNNPWDFEPVYAALYDFARNYPFDPDAEDYLVHITTGSHVAQICLFLLVESRLIPGRLIQTGPSSQPEGRYGIIDLGLARYDQLARRFEAERQEATSVLKGGIATRSASFNALIDEIELVALRSTAPMLLTGPTGAGKSRLARRIWELRRARRLVKGPLVEVNCATLRGDGAMAALFGHKRGAFTGAVEARQGLLREADGGLLFLDEVGELGLDEQAMLLRAIEEKRFLPVGSDKEVESDFQLITGTNRDLRDDVADGRFREDLLARLDLWTFRLPGLAERAEDIAPNLDYELERIARESGRRITISREALSRFMAFAESAPWPRNFRDLTAAVARMATLAPSGRIDEATVDHELGRLRESWRRRVKPSPSGPLAADSPEYDRRITALLEGRTLDRFDEVQLIDVLRVCLSSPSLSEAGRRLFAVSRQERTSTNDADRLRKYLARFGLDFEAIRRGRSAL
ncbi:MAG: sigma 54-interacting transcriptional regulator [Myxococcales bacterium]|nr:sigma 54-interacting transcriptional regulator [Myxococcales bacterium]